MQLQLHLSMYTLFTALHAAQQSTGLCSQERQPCAWTMMAIPNSL